MPFNLVKADITFKVNNKPYKFSIIHNLPYTQGLSINEAVNNWLPRTKEYTPESLCEYITSKDEDFVAITEKEYSNIK